MLAWRGIVRALVPRTLAARGALLIAIVIAAVALPAYVALGWRIRQVRAETTRDVAAQLAIARDSASVGAGALTTAPSALGGIDEPGVGDLVLAVVLAAAGLLAAFTWLHYGVVRPIRNLNRRLVLYRDSLGAVDADGVPLREIEALAASLADLHNELALTQSEADDLRQSIDSRVAALTHHATQAQRMAERAADTDALTQLDNRRVLERELPTAFETARRTCAELSVVLFDLNGFKQLNDTQGHRVGDRVLAFVGTLLRAMVRGSSDRAVRYGGDEFVLLLPNTTPSQAVEIARRLAALFAQWTRTLEGVTHSLGLSAGVAGLQRHGAHSSENLLRMADEAMYWAKRNGRGVATLDEARAGLSA
ncbi:MAG: GGDEF domain-containing protein [Phycisphaerae bacterium]|nr:GGDEF domain-containing protein [Phycisphaerae bacterium]